MQMSAVWVNTWLFTKAAAGTMAYLMGYLGNQVDGMKHTQLSSSLQ